MRAVIFDLGRVLVQYEHTQTLTALAALSQVTVDEIQALFLQVDAALGLGELDAVGLHQFYAQQTGIAVDLERFVSAFAAGLSRIEPALAYAQALQTRPEVMVGIISNTNEAHVYWLDAFVPELRSFDLVMMSNEVGLAKPDPQIYELALELLNIDACDALFIDDLAVNVAGAQSVGLHALVHGDWQVTQPAIERWLATGSLA